MESQKIPGIAGDAHRGLHFTVGAGLSGLYKNLNYAAAGSNDFQRIAKSIEDLDKSVPTIAADVAAPSGAAAASRPS